MTDTNAALAATEQPLAQRMQHIAPFHVMDVIARSHELEAQGRSVIHMEVGQPDFTTAEPIVTAGQQALTAGRTGYTASAGISELRQAIADFYQSRYQVKVAAERILVTPGASGALQIATAALLDAGDQVLMADPAYPCNRHFVRLVDAEPVMIPVGPNNSYQLNAELVEQHWGPRTKAVMLASPSNPTGTLIDAATLAAIIDVTHTRGGVVIMDEIYHGLVYGGESATALAQSDDVFVINSFSKYFGMTGWRLGWLVAPPAYVRAAEKLAQNIYISAPTMAQYAALNAFTPETLAICEQRRQAFQQRRDFLLPALQELGFNIPVTPQGAFYIYADGRRFSTDSYHFAFQALDEAGVAIAPGIDFGEHQAAHHVRFAYTNSLDNLAEGIDRLQRWLN